MSTFLWLRNEMEKEMHVIVPCLRRTEFELQVEKRREILRLNDCDNLKFKLEIII